jgi:Na+/melibiose symporter-like transporter
VLPWFLTQLAADYGRWARGEARSATNASLTEVAAKIIAGSRGKLPAGVEEVECEDVEL